MLNTLNNKFKGKRKVYPFLFFFALLAVLTFTSCEKKKTEEGAVQKETVKEKVEEPVPVDTLKKDTMTVKEPEVVIPDLKGKWSGTLDQRATTLRITEQDGNSIKGAITINYREVINQQVSGTVNVKSMEVSLRDLLHSRYAGTYKGKLSEDLKKFSGTFTQNVEKTRFSFSLKKQ